MKKGPDDYKFLLKMNFQLPMNLLMFVMNPELSEVQTSLVSNLQCAALESKKLTLMKDILTDCNND